MEKYDVIIIGAGMSGMAAAIRLAMFDKKVLLLEKHIITGGLNSYYKRAKRDFDVGLHALTNYMEKGEKRKPLSKLLKQLRIPYDDLKLSPQRHSKIIFPEKSLTFTNDLNDFKATGLYQWVWSLENQFNWYAGVGGGIVSAGETGIYGAGVIGIEYNFEAPVLISIDYRPEIGVSGGLSGLNSDVALSVRYQF